MKWLRFVLYLQANKLACHSFMDVGMKHKTPGLERKDSLLFTAIAVDRVAAFLSVPPGLIHMGWCKEGHLRPIHTVDCVTGEGF